MNIRILKTLSSFFLFIFLSNELLADQGISSDQILIGMHTDISGPASMIGKQSVDGANMRFNEFNENHRLCSPETALVHHLTLTANSPGAHHPAGLR